MDFLNLILQLFKSITFIVIEHNLEVANSILWLESVKKNCLSKFIIYQMHHKNSNHNKISNISDNLYGFIASSNFLVTSLVSLFVHFPKTHCLIFAIIHLNFISITF